MYVTAVDEAEAKKLACTLIQKKLIACANVFPSVLSCYEWESEYREEKEVILILKTRKDLFKKVKTAILQDHSYDCPCVVFIPILEGHGPFLSWIDSKVIAQG